MKIPKRLQILQRLQALLETTLEVEGVNVDMSGKVVRNRNILGDESPAPFLAILESPRPDFAVYAGDDWSGRKDSLTLLIQGRAVDDKLKPGDSAYYLHAAVEERLSRIVATKPNGNPTYPEDFLLGKLITSLEIAPPVVRPPEDKVSKDAFFFLVLRVGIALDIREPYNTVA